MGGGKIKKLRFYKIGEPLLHKDICKMVHYAKEAQIAECIEITTNATLLNEKMNLGLIEAGIDILNISVNGISEEQYQEVCGCQLSFVEFREHIKHFYQMSRGKCKVFIKYGDIGYTKEQKNRFYDLFENICDEIFVEVISSTLWQDTNIGNHIKNVHTGLYGHDLTGKSKQVCPFLFTTMVVNHQGIAHLCCVDWKSEYQLGDLKTKSVSEIWNGMNLQKYQKLHLEKKKDLIPICKNCECLSGHTLDDIDIYAEDIAKRIFKNSSGASS